MNYLEKHSVLTENQFGFRSDRYTCLAVADMIDKVTEKLDAYNYSLGLFIDLSKAFDMLDHAILIAKLEFYGVVGAMLLTGLDHI